MGLDRIAGGDLRTGGVPCVRGTRIPVSVILGRIAEGSSTAEILADYPQVAPEDIVAAAQFTATSVDLRELPIEDAATRPYIADSDQGSRGVRGVHPRSKRDEVLGAELMVVPDSVAAELGLPPGGWGIRRRRITADDSGPVELSTSWFDGRLAGWAPQLLEVVDIPEGTIAYLEKVTTLRATKTRDSITARHARAEEKRLLHLSGSRPAVVVFRHLVTDAVGRPMEYVEAVCALERWAQAVSQPDELPERSGADKSTHPELPAAATTPTAQQFTRWAATKDWLARSAPVLIVSFLGLVLIVAITVLVVASMAWGRA